MTGPTPEPMPVDPDALDRLAAEASPLPWTNEDGAVGPAGGNRTVADCTWPGTPDEDPQVAADAAYIAAACNAAPHLTAEVRRLRADLAAARAAAVLREGTGA